MKATSVCLFSVMLALSIINWKPAVSREWAHDEGMRPSIARPLVSGDTGDFANMSEAQRLQMARVSLEVAEENLRAGNLQLADKALLVATIISPPGSTLQGDAAFRWASFRLERAERSGLGGTAYYEVIESARAAVDMNPLARDRHRWFECQFILATALYRWGLEVRRGTSRLEEAAVVIDDALVVLSGAEIPSMKAEFQQLRDQVRTALGG